MNKLLSILAACMILSCNDIENCDSNEELDFMVVRFFDKATNGSKKIGFTITATNSSFQFVPFTDSTGVGLPLDPNDSQVTFNFDSITTGANYQLVMSYDVEARIFDPDCDPSFSFINLDTVRQTFDSTVVAGTITNRQLITNVEIYF